MEATDLLVECAFGRGERRKVPARRACVEVMVRENAFNRLNPLTPQPHVQAWDEMLYVAFQQHIKCEVSCARNECSCPCHGSLVSRQTGCGQCFKLHSAQSAASFIKSACVKSAEYKEKHGTAVSHALLGTQIDEAWCTVYVWLADALPCDLRQGKMEKKAYTCKHEPHFIHEEGGLSYDSKVYGGSYEERFHIKTMEVGSPRVETSHTPCHVSGELHVHQSLYPAMPTSAVSNLGHSSNGVLDVSPAAPLPFSIPRVRHLLHPGCWQAGLPPPLPAPAFRGAGPPQKRSPLHGAQRRCRAVGPGALRLQGRAARLPCQVCWLHWIAHRASHRPLDAEATATRQTDPHREMHAKGHVLNPELANNISLKTREFKVGTELDARRLVCCRQPELCDAPDSPPGSPSRAQDQQNSPVLVNVRFEVHFSL